MRAQLWGWGIAELIFSSAKLGAQKGVLHHPLGDTSEQEAGVANPDTRTKPESSAGS